MFSRPVVSCFAITAASTIFLAACSSGAATQNDEIPDDDTDEEETVMAEEKREFEGERFEGRIEIDPIAGGKKFQGTWLVTDEGERYLISYRPKQELFPYYDRLVVIDGEEYMPDPRTQHIMADHLRVLSVEVAPGQSPIEPAPQHLPAPPMVDNADDATERTGRWTLATGTLEAIQAPEQGTAYAGTLRLSDGSSFAVNGLDGDSAGEYEGQKVTVIGRIRISDDAPAIPEVRAICKGRVDRCGVEDGS